MLYSVQVIASSKFCRLKSVSSTSLLFGTNLGIVVFSYGGLYFFTHISSEWSAVYNRTYGRRMLSNSKKTSFKDRFLLNFTILQMPNLITNSRSFT